MSLEIIFSYGNNLAMLSWIVLIVAPRWKMTRLIVISGGVTLIFSAVYLMLFIAGFNDISFDIGSLNKLAIFFENRQVLLAGWLHYLAFDLFIGGWEVSDAQKHEISHVLVIPCLLLTFFLGPVGLLLYFLIRAFKTRAIDHSNF